MYINLVGVEPSYETMSCLALAYLNGGRRGTSIKYLTKIPEWGQIAQTIYKSFISEALKRGDSEKAENLFSVVRTKCLPSPEITGLILMNYGKVNGFYSFIYFIYLIFFLIWFFCRLEDSKWD